MKKRLFSYVVVCLLFAVALFSGNVSAANTSALGLNKTVRSSGTEREAEIYQIKVKTPGKLNINFKHENLFETKTYWTIEVLAKDMETVLQTIYSTGVDENLTASSLGLSKGTYYIRVWSRKECNDNYSDADYRLTAKFKKSADWEVEYNEVTKRTNDEQAGAKTISVNKAVSGTVLTRDDVDFFKVKIKKKGYIVLKMSHKNVLDSEICWNVALVDSKTNVITSIQSLGTQKSASTARIGVTPGTYYVKVSAGRNHNAADYAVTVGYKAANNWETEYKSGHNNNDLNYANTVAYGGSIMGTLATEDDVDYFKFRVPAKKTVTVALSHKYKANSDSFYKVTVLSSKLNELAHYDCKGVNKTSRKKFNLKKGVYYIKVEKGSAYNKMDYTISVK